MPGHEYAIVLLLRALLLIVCGSLILLLGTIVAAYYSIYIGHNIISGYSAAPLMLLLIGVGLVLFGASNLYKGFGRMHDIGNTYEMGRYGSIVQLAASILLTVGFYLIIFSGSSKQTLGSEFAIVGYILGYACAVPVGAAFRKLGQEYDESITKFGAVVYVLIPIIGPSILYFGLSRIKKTCQTTNENPAKAKLLFNKGATP